MKARTTSILVGSFVLGGLLIAALFAVFLTQSEFWVQKSRFVLNFENSVSGLSEGSPVQFRGVRIGRVTDVRVVTNPKTMTVNMPVYIEIDPRRIRWKEGKGQVDELFSDLIDRGMRARVRNLSYITGQRMVELDIMPGTPAKMAQRDLKYPEIPTAPSRMQKISRTVQELPLQELLTKLTSALEGIERTINSPQVSESLKNLNKSLQTARSVLTDLDKDVPQVANQLNTTLGSAQGMMQRTDKRLERLALELHNASQAAEDAFDQMEGTLSLDQGTSGELASSMERALEAARSTLQQTETSLAAVEDMAGDSELRYQLKDALKEVSSAAGSIRSLARYLERHPDALWRGKGSN